MSYRRSTIYQLGFALVLKVENVCRLLPQHEQFSLAQQIRNSSRSIVANYVEGYARQGRSPADLRRFILYSQGSCDETKYWLELAHHLGFIDTECYEELNSQYERLGRMIYAVLRDTA